MIGAYLALLVLLGCALLIGQALAGLAHGARRDTPTPLSWLAPAYGLGGLLVLGAVAVRLPGHAITVAVVVVLATLASAVYLRGRVAQIRARAPIALCAGLIAVLVASLPFMIAGNVGVLGVGLVNDDMASHLIIADYVADPGGHVPSFVRGGYPIGPHALAAALELIPGAGMVEAFAALTLSLAALHALLGAGLLRGLSSGRRMVGAALIALPYLGAAYLAQGAFKEPLQALLLIGFALTMAPLIGLRSPLSIGAPDASSQRQSPATSGPKLTMISSYWPLGREGGDAEGSAAGPDHAEAPAAARHPLLRILPLAVLAAASVLNYSTPGLLWVSLLAVALIFTRVVIVRPRPRLPEIDWRKLAPYALGAIVIVALATFQEWGRIADFSRISALNPDRFGSDLGNLGQSLSPLEVLGIWPSGEFDATPTSTGVPAIVFYLGAAIGLAALLCGLQRDRRQHLETMPTLLAAMAIVWVLSSLFASPYIAAKALAVAAPVVMTLAVRGTFGEDRGPRLALGVVFVLLAAGSSFLVLRAAPVGPDDAASHGAQLETMREIVAGEEVLFLGRDDFIRWHLRGSDEITGIVTNFYDVEDARPRFKKGEGRSSTSMPSSRRRSTGSPTCWSRPAGRPRWSRRASARPRAPTTTSSTSGRGVPVSARRSTRAGSRARSCAASPRRRRSSSTARERRRSGTRRR